MTTWVVVADGTRARILEASSANGPLNEIDGLVHPEGRLRDRELTSDLPGRAFDSGGQGRHAMESKVDPKRQEHIRFAAELADFLEAARVAHKFDELVIVAAPTFLGQLRDKLSRAITRLITSQIDKDLTLLSVDDIRTRLPERHRAS